jgi:hypothetical protein
VPLLGVSKGRPLAAPPMMRGLLMGVSLQPSRSERAQRQAVSVEVLREQRSAFGLFSLFGALRNDLCSGRFSS